MTGAEAAVREYMAELAASGGGPFSGVKGPPTFSMPAATPVPTWSAAAAYAEPRGPVRYLRAEQQAARYPARAVAPRQERVPPHLAGQLARYKKP